MISASILKDWDEKIRLGMGQDVAEEISKVKISEILEAHYADFVNCARRVGLYGPIFALFKNEYFKIKESPMAQESFMVEYAAMLSEVGATRVAYEIFHKFQYPQENKTHFYLALHSMKTWNYESAVGHLLTFIDNEKESYWLDIARLNLMSCYLVNRQLEEAGEIYETLLANSSRLRPMARGILHEQRAECLYMAQRYEEAQGEINKALVHLEEAGGPAALYARKWKIVIYMKILGFSEIKDKWESFYKECEEQGHWEVIRDLDRIYAIEMGEEKLLHKVYFGTPHRNFRNLMELESGWTAPPNFQSVPDAPFKFDRETARLLKQGKDVKLPELFRRLLFVLTSDNYRTFAVGFLFDQIYRGEYFHPDFAGQRIYRLISRFRSFCDDLGLPLVLSSTKLGFKLEHCESFAICDTRAIARPRWMIGHDHLIEEIKEDFKDRAIYAQDVAETYNLSKRTANRILARGVEEGIFQKHGNSRSTHYKTAA